MQTISILTARRTLRGHLCGCGSKSDCKTFLADSPQVNNTLLAGPASGTQRPVSSC
ncbi:hypothetical protein [Providencia rettgeri]|uniref:hypothetical protein n=1 Tax=Providencia rettgeri TaxID=587 RepID=UPI0023AA99E3|nr:hypothetical protein [Providencia rettgeri]